MNSTDQSIVSCQTRIEALRRRIEDAWNRGNRNAALKLSREMDALQLLLWQKTIRRTRSAV